MVDSLIAKTSNCPKNTRSMQTLFEMFYLAPFTVAQLGETGLVSTSGNEFCEVGGEKVAAFLSVNISR